MLQVHHPLVGHQIVHSHHLLLDHKRLPIVLVEHCLEGVHCILVSADLDRAELEHLSVIADPMTLVCSESRVHEVESISYFGLEIEY